MDYMKDFSGSLLIRRNDKGLLERYDRLTKQWVRDHSLSEIYYGGISVEHISKEDMDKLIKEVK